MKLILIAIALFTLTCVGVEVMAYNNCRSHGGTVSACVVEVGREP